MFQEVFDHSPNGREVIERLLALRQGSRREAEYVPEFCMLTVESGWNDSALKAVFRQGLNGNILRVLACRDDAATLDSLIHLSIRLDNLLIEHFPRSLEGNSFKRATTLLSRMSMPNEVFAESSAYVPSHPEPMDLNVSTLRTLEREKRRLRGLCFYCSEGQH